MNKSLRRLLTVLVIAAAFVAAAPAGADSDHERAREARERGEILPLEQILARVRDRIPAGDIVKVELDRDHGVWIYEFKVIDPRGRLLEVEVDAGTGRILEVEED